MNQALVDTGPLVALYNKNDAHHDECVDAARDLPRGLLTCWPVLTEAAWLLRERPAGLSRLLSDVEQGSFALVSLGAAAVPWIGHFLERYANVPAQLADAALMYLADREQVGTIFTLDRRDFSIYRTDTGAALHIVP